jgi:hypothetical protein
MQVLRFFTDELSGDECAVITDRECGTYDRFSVLTR